MELTLTILGCSGSFPGPGTACSSYLVQGGGVNVVVDMGPGSLTNLQQHIGLGDIDAVILSHAHPDHWVDLTGLETAWKYKLGREGVPVYGTAGTHDLAAGLIGDLAPTIDFREIDDTTHVAVGGLAFDFSATRHYVETMAVRIAHGGATIAYSADTGTGWSFAEFGASIDLALCEATTLADGEAEDFLHLSARQAGAMVRAAGIERVVFTHLEPGVDPVASQAEGEAAYGGPVHVARIHDSFQI